MPREQLEMVRPFFELGWVMGVRTGHTGPALVGVPVDPHTVARAFVLLPAERVADPMVIAVAQSLDPQHAGPVLWQRVDYHGSVTGRHVPTGYARSTRTPICSVRRPSCVTTCVRWTVSRRLSGTCGGGV
ncbi:hypothetical protein ACWCQK_39915 [Streptomyces sp. NPDC002306]